MLGIDYKNKLARNRRDLRLGKEEGCKEFLKNPLLYE